MIFVHYLPGTGKENKVQAVWPSCQETVPEMCGGWPPELEDCKDREVYKALDPCYFSLILGET
jgi:hypothetical protein